MAKQVTVWKANDGSTHETEANAIERDEELIVEAHIDSILSILLNGSYIEGEQMRRVKNNIIRSFNEKNPRKIIRKLLELTATNDND